jgi:hypothetical protein
VKAFLFAMLVTAAATATSGAAELKLDIHDGKVTLDARDVTVRQILTEWARVGQTRILNLERAGSGPVTLQLAAVPERQALDIILRSLSGYLAAPRAAGSAGASTYDRILILASTSVVSAPRSQVPATPGRTPPGGAQPRAVMPGPGTPDLMLPEPDDQGADTDMGDGPAGQVAPGRGGGPFGVPPGGAAVQPGMMPQPMGMSEPLSLPAYQVPATMTSPATPSSTPAGAVTPGVVIAAPQPAGTQPVPSGVRPPRPYRP